MKQTKDFFEALLASNEWLTTTRLKRAITGLYRQLRVGFSAFMVTIIVAFGSHSAGAQEISVESLIVVDCLLPGQVRQLGPVSKYITPRRPLKTSARDCAIRGGEYVAYDRSDYKSALKVWMTDAETGDAKAQTYVAEIYERGLGTPPNYSEAAKWYGLASEQNYKPAQLSLGRLYEAGLGVEKDILLALNLYRAANDLEADELSFLSDMQSAAKSGTQKELNALRKQVKQLEKTNQQLESKLRESAQQAEGSSVRLQQLEKAILDKQALLEQASQGGDLKPVVAGLQMQIAELQQQLTKGSEQAASESARLTQEVARAELALEEAKASDSSSLVALMQTQLAQQQQQIEQARNASQLELQQSQAAIVNLSEQLANARQQAKSDKEVLRLQATLEQQRLEHQQQTQRQQAAILAVENALATQQQAFQEAQDQNDSSAMIAMLEAQVAQQQHDLESASEQNESLQSLLRNEITLRKRQAELLEDQSSAKKLIANLKSEIKQQTKLFNAESKRNQELMAQVQLQSHQLAANQNKHSMATDSGPTIVLKVPPLVASRGLNEVSVQPGQQVYLAGGVVVPAGVKSFTYNGTPAELDVNNLFMIQVDVKNQDIPMELKIVDNQNRENTKNILLKPTAPEQPVASSEKPSRKLKWGKYHALVIGNNTYVDPKWANLSNAVNDAKTVASVLTDKYGFDTTLLLNATRVQMLEAIESMRNKLTEDDNLLIYYAGHGQRDDANNRAYWIPVDSSADSSTNWIPSYQVTDHVNAMNARHVLLVVDSCYAGLMTRASGVNAMLVGMTPEQKQQKMKDRLGRRTRMLITAGDNTEVLDGGAQGNHSIFAEAFIAALENNSDVLDSEGVFKVVQPYVSKHTYRINKQSVVYAPIPSARHEGGEFYFNALSGG